MATSSRAVVTLPGDTEILITSDFAAPRHLVYRAWTEPELIRRWWHANRGTMTVVEVDLRVGGRWRYAMLAHGSFEVGFHGVYRDIVPNERLVSTEVYEGIPDAEAAAALDTATFEDLAGGGTRVTILVQHVTRAHRDAHIESGMEDGLQDALVLLEQAALSLA